MRRVERVLDVRQGELCWVAGTVYLELPLKPNILDDISKDVSFFVFSFLTEIFFQAGSPSCLGRVLRAFF